jgi:excisionase family DNA binding protein
MTPRAHRPSPPEHSGLLGFKPAGRSSWRPSRDTPDCGHQRRTRRQRRCRATGPAQDPYWDLDLLTLDDVCALLKVKKSWLYDAVESGALEAVRLGKQLRFRPSALARYLDERVSNVNGGG